MWWAAVLVALGLTAIGAFIDLLRISQLGVLFQASYFFGCLLSVILVQRKSLFGPMVQPPLILAAAVPGVVLLGGGSPAGEGLVAKLLAVATPLINGFPTMAVTTVLTLAVGGFRLLTQRRPAAQREWPQRPRQQPQSRPQTGRTTGQPISRRRRSSA